MKVSVIYKMAFGPVNLTRNETLTKMQQRCSKTVA